MGFYDMQAFECFPGGYKVTLIITDAITATFYIYNERQFDAVSPDFNETKREREQDVEKAKYLHPHFKRDT